MRATKLLASGAILAASTPALSQPVEPVWFAGDFHVHTCYSHDAYCGPDDDSGPTEIYTASGSVEERFAEAAARGLDFLAITDHMDIRAHADPDFGAFGVSAVRAYEHSMNGHSQMLGATKLYSHGSGLAGAQQMADDLREDGGLFQINHPTSALVDPIDDCSETSKLDWGYGTSIVPDTIEVWNIWNAWQPPMPASNSNDDAEVFWECFLNAGHQVTPTGGSDSHWLSTSAVQGPGNPTTWVLSGSSDEAGVFGALRDGHTSISMLPPHEGGFPLILEADSDGDGNYEAIQGDEISAGATVRISNALAPGFARIRTNHGQVFEEVLLPQGEVTFALPEGTKWARAVLVTAHPMVRSMCPIDDRTTYCRNRLVVASISSPLYVAI